MNNLTLTTSPHIYKKRSVPKIMWLVNLSLLPAGIAGVLIFGPSALEVIILCIGAAMITEAVLQRLAKKPVTIGDGSAFLTGLLLAYCLPPRLPFWVPIAGSFFAIAIGKQIFGGLGYNIFNPALIGRAFLMAAWPRYITAFPKPLIWYDAVTAATPLAQLKEGKMPGGLSYFDFFTGNRGGCIGEVCIVALLAGALFLLLCGYISWHIPLTYILTVAAATYIFGGSRLFAGDWIFHLLGGGLALGAFFMATDYVTSPLTKKGKITFGIGCGILTAVIRLWGGYPEGVCYAILIMNSATPFIDRYTRSRIYGTT